jgi:hypothetical protein
LGPQVPPGLHLPLMSGFLGFTFPDLSAQFGQLRQKPFSVSFALSHL